MDPCEVAWQGAPTVKWGTHTVYDGRYLHPVQVHLGRCVAFGCSEAGIRGFGQCLDYALALTSKREI